MTRCFLENFLNISIVALELTLSKAPVGSSANIIFGLLIMLLTRATLCFSPPEQVLTGFLLFFSSKPTSFNNSKALLNAYSFLSPAISIGKEALKTML